MTLEDRQVRWPMTRPTSQREMAEVVAKDSSETMKMVDAAKKKHVDTFLDQAGEQVDV